MQTRVVLRVFSRIDESRWHRTRHLVIIIVSFVNRGDLLVLVVDDDVGDRSTLVVRRFVLEVLLVAASLEVVHWIGLPSSTNGLPEQSGVSTFRRIFLNVNILRVVI